MVPFQLPRGDPYEVIHDLYIAKINRPAAMFLLLTPRVNSLPTQRALKNATNVKLVRDSRSRSSKCVPIESLYAIAYRLFKKKVAPP